jgi:hypothetical protein
MALLRETQRGTEYVLTKRTTVLGREESCDLRAPTRLVSAHHARIRKGLLGYVIEDLGSSNGTFVNGERIRKAKRLRDGDVIVLAMVPGYAEKIPPGAGLRETTKFAAPPAPCEVRRGEFRLGIELTFRK